jgi:hypothetical protein
MSSKRHIRRKQCSNKRRYPEMQPAQYAAFLAGKRWGGKFNCYHCRFCGGWHFGHAPGFVQQKLGMVP